MHRSPHAVVEARPLWQVPTPGQEVDQALEPRWHVEDAGDVVVIYPGGGEWARDVVRQGLGDVYQQLSSVLGSELALPLTVRLHPDVASYLEANPLVVDHDGLLAGSRRGRREIELIVPQDADVEELTNALRREIGRLLVQELTGDRLPDGLLEATAGFMARPAEGQAISIASLREAFSRDALLRWSDMSGPGSAYLEPRIARPEGLSMVHFLVEEYGMPRYLELLQATSAAPSWRAALESTYGVAAEELEARWWSWLPGYLDGGWQRHPLYASDLSREAELLEAGRFEEARSRLEVLVPLLGSVEPDMAARAAGMLEEARSGAAATDDLAAAREALAGGLYSDAAAAAAAAAVDLETLGHQEQAEAAAEIVRRARIGIAAGRDLRRAQDLPPWRAAEGRMLAASAARGYAEIGNDAAADRARELIAQIDARIRPVAAALLLAGAMVLGWNVRARTKAGSGGKARS